MPQQVFTPDIDLGQKIISTTTANPILTDLVDGYTGGQYGRMSLDELSGHFGKSLGNGDRCKPKINARNLFAFSHKIPIHRAIERISNGVASLDWNISYSKNIDQDFAHEFSQKIRDAILVPNMGENNTFTEFVKDVVRSLLVYGIAIIRRHGEYHGSKPIWFWHLPIVKRVPTHSGGGYDVKAMFRLDSNWDASYEGIHPRFWYTGGSDNSAQWQAIYNKDIIVIEVCPDSTDYISNSPLKIVFDDLWNLCNLQEFQGNTVSQAWRHYLFNLENATQDEVHGFREMMNASVGTGQVPVIAGKVNVLKYGAKNDEELYLGFEDKLVTRIALAFNLSRKDMGLTDDLNYATAQEEGDASYQQSQLPIAKLLFEHLNVSGVHYYYPDYTLELSQTEKRKQSEKETSVAALWRDDVITRNEARQEIGKPPIPDGDKFKSGAASDGEPTPGGNVSPENKTIQGSAAKHGSRKKSKENVTQLRLF